MQQSVEAGYALRGVMSELTEDNLNLRAAFKVFDLNSDGGR